MIYNDKLTLQVLALVHDTGFLSLLKCPEAQDFWENLFFSDSWSLTLARDRGYPISRNDDRGGHCSNGFHGGFPDEAGHYEHRAIIRSTSVSQKFQLYIHSLGRTKKS